jgi:hypothetical protein
MLKELALAFRRQLSIRMRMSMRVRLRLIAVIMRLIAVMMRPMKAWRISKRMQRYMVITRITRSINPVLSRIAMTMTTMMTIYLLPPQAKSIKRRRSLKTATTRTSRASQVVSRINVCMEKIIYIFFLGKSKVKAKGKAKAKVKGKDANNDTTNTETNDLFTKVPVTKRYVESVRKVYEKLYQERQCITFLLFYYLALS